MSIRRFLAAVGLSLALISPCAAASSEHVIAIPAATYTTSQFSAPIDVTKQVECAILSNITAASGTTPTWTASVDTSIDGGTTWVSAIATGTALTAVSSQLFSIGSGMTGNSIAFGDTIRVHVVIAGTTPSFTGSVTVVCK